MTEGCGTYMKRDYEFMNKLKAETVKEFESSLHEWDIDITEDYVEVERAFIDDRGFMCGLCLSLIDMLAERDKQIENLNNLLHKGDFKNKGTNNSKEFNGEFR